MFTSLFAIGVILLSVYGANVHLDIEHSLMGEIAFVPWNTVTVLGVDITSAQYRDGHSLHTQKAK